VSPVGAVQAYVINLGRSPDRRAHMAAEMAKAGLPWRFVEAVDARKANLARPGLIGLEMAVRPEFRPGSLACALSHQLVYEEVLSSGLAHALVLEDDVILPQDLASLAEAVTAEMCSAEVALFNFHRPGGLRLRAEGAVALPGGRLLCEPLSLSQLTSGAAYMVTAGACRRLGAALFPMRCFSDEWEWFVSQGVLDKVRCIAPMPVANSTSFRTTIDYYPPGSLRWSLREVAARSGLLGYPPLRLLAEKRRRRDSERHGRLGQAEVVGQASSAEGPRCGR
jgi:glycosyl transferase family 25